MYVIRDKIKYRAKVRTKSQSGNTGFTDGLHITGEVEKYQPVRVSREDIPLTKTNTEKDSTQDDGLTQMCGGYTIDELHHALCLEQENPGSTALKDVMKLYE